MYITQTYNKNIKTTNKQNILKTIQKTIYTYVLIKRKASNTHTQTTKTKHNITHTCTIHKTTHNNNNGIQTQNNNTQTQIHSNDISNTKKQNQTIITHTQNTHTTNTHKQHINQTIIKTNTSHTYI